MKTLEFLMKIIEIDKKLKEEGLINNWVEYEDKMF